MIMEHDKIEAQEEAKISQEPGAINDEVCEDCASLDLNAIFSNETGLASFDSIKFSEWEACIGNPSPQSICPACRFFFAMIVPSQEVEVLREEKRCIDPDTLEEIWSSQGQATVQFALKAFSANHIWHMPWFKTTSKTISFGVFPRGTRIDEYECAANGLNLKQELSWEQTIYDRQSPGFILQADSNATGDPEKLRGRILNERRIDWDIIKDWIHFCNKNHGYQCKLIAESYPSGFKLIDCHTRCVIEPSRNVKYLALSYVWKDSHSLDADTKYSPTLPQYCPTVIEDAIQVVKSLGEQYLWVDRYCIDQENETQTHNQISRMDSIYEGSLLTIIAATGKDSPSGLAGVGSVPRMRQPRVKLGNFSLVSSLPNPVGAIQDSKWASRGWTYQEGLLSKRRLIFTDHQVYWQCLGMHCLESIRMPLDLWHVRHSTRFPDEISFSRLYPPFGTDLEL
ncbi:HET-domain-containing protein [Microthyrium microscopicum]|uniref:HET-domain-containing protein n=1 Tax=Microthyrium microscopicum TaxID=703497 RepID=A0A6A6TUR1_9PEZI|nr:HET-domain-containing protein [Microthyrium microscopicum]